MAKTRVPQKTKVLTILNQGKTLTQAVARTRYKIASLSSRVNELRQDGVDIVSTRVQVRDRETGTRRSIVRYGLAN